MCVFFIHRTVWRGRSENKLFSRARAHTEHFPTECERVRENETVPRGQPGACKYGGKRKGGRCSESGNWITSDRKGCRRAVNVNCAKTRKSDGIRREPLFTFLASFFFIVSYACKGIIYRAHTHTHTFDVYRVCYSISIETHDSHLSQKREKWRKWINVNIFNTNIIIIIATTLSSDIISRDLWRQRRGLVYTHF